MDSGAAPASQPAARAQAPRRPPGQSTGVGAHAHKQGVRGRHAAAASVRAPAWRAIRTPRGAPASRALIARVTRPRPRARDEGEQPAQMRARMRASSPHACGRVARARDEGAWRGRVARARAPSHSPSHSPSSLARFGRGHSRVAATLWDHPSYITVQLRIRDARSRQAVADRATRSL